MYRRTRSNLSLFDAMVSDRRHEFRYSTYHIKPIDKNYPLAASISKLYRKKGTTLHPIEHRLELERLSSSTPKKNRKTVLVSNSHLFKRLAKDYILPERRLSSFRRKSWRLAPILPKLENAELQRIMQQQELAKCETKYMMRAMLEIIEDYNIENSSMACKPNVASSRRCKENDERRKSRPFEIPNEILKKYKDLNVPRNKYLLRKLLRPHIYFEVQRLGCPMLQLIVVELYTEACPQVVLEFVRRCSQNCFQRFSFTSSFPGLWIEAGLKLDCDTLINSDIEYDMRALDHASSAGILSFAGRYVQGFRKCLLDFSVSVNPLPEMNCTRVAFGVVISGLNVLEYMQLYDMRCCDGIHDYRIVGCGLMRR